MRRTAAIALVVAAACAPPARGVVGTSCELNSECDTPLVCRLGYCRNECATSADCAAGLACLLDSLRLGACQLPAETNCTLPSECPAGLVCRFMQCTNECEADRDCSGGARCERAAEGLACVERSGVPCVLDGECDPAGTGARCVMGRCRRECFTDRDCRNDFRCQAGVCTPPPATTSNCDAFTEDSGLVVRPGFRAVVVADASDGLVRPVALTFAGDGYGGALYVVSSGLVDGTSTLHRVDVAAGTTSLFSTASSWGFPHTRLTTIVWDTERTRDGALYVGEYGVGLDGDGAIYRLAEDGTATSVIMGPGAGLDDVFALAFAPLASGYAPGLYVAGNTNNTAALPDWGIVSGSAVTTFSEVSNIEGASFDVTGEYGGSLWAARPTGSGWMGDSTITPIDPTGAPGVPILTGEPGIHAVTFSVGGPFGQRMYAASWRTGRVIEIAPDGALSDVASGLMLSSLDGNILAVPSDGGVMFVADHLANRVVCIEPL